MSHPIDEHVIEMGEVTRAPKAALSARHGSQDIPLLNAPVRRTLLGFSAHLLNACSGRTLATWSSDMHLSTFFTIGMCIAMCAQSAFAPAQIDQAA